MKRKLDEVIDYVNRHSVSHENSTSGMAKRSVFYEGRRYFATDTFNLVLNVMYHAHPTANLYDYEIDGYTYAKGGSS